jgi:hypothetical protein
LVLFTPSILISEVWLYWFAVERWKPSTLPFT